MDPTRWVAFQGMFDSAMPPGVRAYWRNAWFATLGDRAIDALDAGCGAQTWVGTAADLHHMGGAFARVPEAATAFPDRSASHWLNLYGFWSDPADDPARIAWVKEVSDSLRPWAMPTRYVNFLGHEDDPTLRRASGVYGPDKLARLTALKQRYDPGNLFRINHNIPPEPP